MVAFSGHHFITFKINDLREVQVNCTNFSIANRVNLLNREVGSDAPHLYRHSADCDHPTTCYGDTAVAPNGVGVSSKWRRCPGVCQHPRSGAGGTFRTEEGS